MINRNQRVLNRINCFFLIINHLCRQPEFAVRQNRRGDRRGADGGRDRPRAGATGNGGARSWNRCRPRHRVAGDRDPHRRMGEESGSARLCAGSDHHGGGEGESRRNVIRVRFHARNDGARMPPFESLPYRPCAGMMVLNRAGLVFVGRRSSGPEHIDATHVWQMPQGGIDENEDPYKAALRELHEETNIRSVDKLGEIANWLAYNICATSSARPGAENIAGRSRNGMRCVLPALKARSTSQIPAAIL